MKPRINTSTAKIRTACVPTSLTLAIRALLRKKEGNWIIVRDRVSPSSRSTLNSLKYTPVSPFTPDVYALGIDENNQLVPTHRECYSVWVSEIALVKTEWRLVPVNCDIVTLRALYKDNKETRVPIDMKVIERMLNGNA